MNLYARWQARQEHVEGAKVVHQPVQAQPLDRLTLTTLGLQQICFNDCSTCSCSELVCGVVHWSPASLPQGISTSTWRGGGRGRGEVWESEEKQAVEFKMDKDEVEREDRAGNCLAIARRPREDIPVDRLLFCLHPLV